MFNRILHLVHTPRHSGAEALVRDLCLFHQARGIDTAIASISPAPPDYHPTLEKLRAAGVKLYLPEQPKTGFQRARHFEFAYGKFLPDIVYGHAVLPALWGRLALPLIKRSPPFVSVLHSATNDDYAERKLWLAELFLALRTDCIFAVSDAGAAAYRRRIPFAPSIAVVPNGANLDRIRSAASLRQANRAHYGLQDGDTLVLQVGRLSPTKQQRLSLAAVLPVLRDNPKAMFWLAGLTEDAGYERALRDDISEAGVESQVRLLGGREDVPELLSAADLYVMPSVMEAHSIAMIEALASGIPIAASDIPTFGFLSGYSGVATFPASDIGQFQAAVRELLRAGGRYERDVSRFEITNVAAIYGRKIQRA
jgi:L-malate glycosyltransferase